MPHNKIVYDKLIQNNKEWVAEKLELDPKYFEDLSKEQTPAYLFIGCSDSRVPVETITKMQPGEAFVHRNIANLVLNIDLNSMSVLHYAVEYLKVKHIIVCGHYGCGGIKAAMGDGDFGLINQWLLNIKDLYKINKEELDSIEDETLRYRRLVELNVIQQANNLSRIPCIQKNSPPLRIHAWVYELETGLINDLDF